eukprot:c8493_g2_i1.p1 GENE.c8493_g2_i1~~c8493_g2_i1.p1  ORF type:complete len:436 (-),score=145.70 c8493_g2_i1:23-1330(-)
MSHQHIGVTLALLKELNLSPTATTGEVCQHIVKPMTKNSRVSYVDLLRADKPSREDIGPASVYVSHFWAYPYQDVIHMLEEYTSAVQNDYGDKDMFFWIDVVCMNHHATPQPQLEPGWFSSTLKDTICSIGNTLVLFDSPEYVNRAWCLWELYLSLANNTRVDIVLPTFQRTPSESAFLLKFHSIVLALHKVDITRALAADDEVLQLIVEAAEQTADGTQGVNAVVVKELRDCFGTTAHKALAEHVTWTSEVETAEVADLLHHVGQIMNEAGRREEARAMFVQSLGITQRVLGEDHSHNAVLCNSLAALLEAQGKFADAEQYCRLALQVREREYGENHPITATACNSLVAVLLAQLKYDEAEHIAIRALDIATKALGPHHHYTAISCKNLAVVLKAKGEREEAEALALRAIAIFEKELDPDHSDIIEARKFLDTL